MAQPDQTNRVTLEIGMQQHTDWLNYSIDSDLLTPADAWHLVVAIHGQRPAFIKRAAAIRVRIGPDLVLTGQIDSIKHHISKTRQTLTLSGRDAAAVLVDCSAPIFAAQKIDLKQIIETIAKPLGITSVKIQAQGDLTREKINVEPGDTAWQAIQNAAEAEGLWPWMQPDGTLTIGGPDYNSPPVATLVLKQDGKGNNCEALEEADDIAQAHSEVTVLAQAHGAAWHAATPGIKAAYKDPCLPAYRPKIVVDHESDDLETAKHRARKLQQDSRLKAYTLTATVAGHRINAPGQPGDSQLWTPGQRVQVISEPHNIDAVFFLMGRTFTGGRNQPTQTQLRLKEDAMWIVEAHPHKRKHRRGSNAIGHEQILEITP